MPYYESGLLGAVSQRELGRALRAFADEAGTWGNIILVHRPHYLDVRAVMIFAGLTPGKMPVIETDLDDVARRIAVNAAETGENKFDSSKDLLFVFSYQDELTLWTLFQWFPDGVPSPLWTRLGTPYPARDPAVLFRVPALGVDGLNDFLSARYAPVADQE
jgi:hypothetical protein